MVRVDTRTSHVIKGHVVLNNEVLAVGRSIPGDKPKSCDRYPKTLSLTAPILPFLWSRDLVVSQVFAELCHCGLVSECVTAGARTAAETPPGKVAPSLSSVNLQPPATGLRFKNPRRRVRSNWARRNFFLFARRAVPHGFFLPAYHGRNLS